MKRGYLVLKVLGFLLMTIAGVLAGWEIATNYSDAIKGVLPYGFWIFIIVLVVVGILLEVWATKREKGKDKPFSMTGAYKQ